MQVASGKVVLQDTTDAVSASVASLVTSGGLGVGKTVFAGSALAGQRNFQSSVVGDAFGIRNLNVAGYSSIAFYNDAGVGQMSLGWANGSASVEPGSGFIYSSTDLNLDSGGSVVISSSD